MSSVLKPACGHVGCTEDAYVQAYVPGVGRRVLCEDHYDEDEHRNPEVLDA